MATNFQVTATGAAAPLSATSVRNYDSVCVKALSANSGSVFIGLAGVTAATGFELAAGEALTLDRSFGGDLAKLFIIDGGSGDVVCVLAS